MKKEWDTKVFSLRGNEREIQNTLHRINGRRTTILAKKQGGFGKIDLLT